MKIDFDKIFLAEVWQVINYGYTNEYNSKFLKSCFVDKAFVYKYDLGFYKDLKTGKYYNNHCTDVTGSYFVNEEKGMIPFKNLINEKKQDSTKRKVLFGRKKRTK